MQSTIFAKRVILDVSLGSEYVFDYCLWIRLCVFYYFFHFESIKFRSSRSQISFKIDVFKNFRNIHRKTTMLETFCNKVPGIPINITAFLRTTFLIEHLRQLLFKAMVETCQNFTMKNKKGIIEYIHIQ